MEGRTFPAAIWAASWDDIKGDWNGCVQGVASLAQEGGLRVEIPFGQLLGDDARVELGGSPLPTQLDWIYGLSQKGQWLALENARSLGTGVSYPGAAHQTLTGSRLLVGEGPFDPSGRVSVVEMTVNGLAEWLGRSPITGSARLGEGHCRGFSIAVDLEDGSTNAVLLDGNGVKVSVYHRITRKDGVGLGVDIEHRAVLRLEFAQPRKLAEAEEVALRTGDFLSLCFGFYAEPEKAVLGFEDGASAELLLPLVKGRASEKAGDWQMPLRYPEIEDKVGLMLARWLDADGWLHNASGFLVSLLFKSWQFPVDLGMIAAAQMLEALSKAGADTKSMPDAEFSAYKSAVRGALDGIGDKYLAQMAKERIHPANIKGQERLLKELLERHGAITSFVLGDPASFVKAHVELRNGITHRDPGLQTVGEEIFWHTETVLLLGYCIVAEELGLDAATVTAGTGRSRFKSGAVAWAKKRYPAKPASGGAG